MLARRSRPHPAAVVESQVMGRAAVGIVVALVQPTAVGQLMGLAQGSQTLDELGVPHLADAWAITMVLAGVAMVASYLLPRQDDTRVLEIAANAFVALVTVVHLVAILHEVGYSGSSYTCALDASLFINCSGRSLFLARQIWWVERRARGSL